MKKYSIDILKKINFELGNAIKTACDISCETEGVGTKDRLKGQEQELIQVGGGMHKHNTETSLEPGWSEPMLSQASHETCSGDQDGSKDDVVHGREHVSMLRVDEEEALNNVQEGADKQVQVSFESNGIRPAQPYSRDHVDDAGHGRNTCSMLRDVDEEAVDDVDQAGQQVLRPLDCNEDGSVVTNNELLDETTSTQLRVQGSNESCVKKAQPKKRSFSRQEVDRMKKSLKMSRLNRDDDDEVQLRRRPFSSTGKGYQNKFGIKTRLNKHIASVHMKKKPFSCKADGCQVKFVCKRRMETHFDEVHLKKRPFKCCHCSKDFGRKQHLSLHIKIVHQKEKAFLCQEPGCGKKFGAKRELQDHMRSAHGVGVPFKCSICSKAFGSMGILSTHIKIVHQKEKAFICQEPGCGKKFGQNNELKDHMRSVHKAPKLVCKKVECSATFVWATKLYKHMREDH